MAFPLVYLSVRHATNLSLFLLAFLSILYWLINSRSFSVDVNKSFIWAALLGFSSLFISTGITQLIRGDFHIQSFDGPSRIFLAGLVFLYLLSRPIASIKLLELTLPIGLVLLTLAIQNLEIGQPWGGRFTTSFVDANTLGSQTSILSIMCIFLIRQPKKNYLVTILKVIGGVTGLYISIHAGSRGGWLALSFLLILWMTLNLQSDFHDKKISKRQLLLRPIGTALIVVILFIITYQYIPTITTRIMEAQHDIIQWLAGVNFNSSVGTRLAMWEISLFQLAPLGGFSGIGDISSIAATVAQLQLNPNKYSEAIFNLSYAGPHSDFLDNLLRMGYIGAVAYIITIAIPWLIFWKNRLNQDLDKRLAAQMGLYFTTGIFFCGLANGMITHKYTCSFYGLIIACLLADVLRSSTSTHTQSN
jgi:O-antigen ligase